ncbi:Transposon, En/Spm-like protein [Quillaja saponaria]|uniref:Transposon, En/Spm-like protein n=1 Tax=Quillaja saponaria TaxID=32244 RepID=A0AAD7VHL5_QUISA|nr:Transposon, En/Spm-like protein [Quillaja saponaria]
MSRDEITVCLFKKGFLRNYKWWTLHGEGEEWLGETSNDRGVDIGDSSNRYVDMVMDAAGPDFNWDEESQLPNELNSDAKRFFVLLQNADEELWEGCSWHTRLSAVTQLLNCKSEFNMSEKCYDRIVSVVKVMNMKGKTKDNLNARMDLKLFCKRPELELKEYNGKLIMPKAYYSLSKPQLKEVCEWIKDLRLSDEYAANLARCVNIEDSKVGGPVQYRWMYPFERMMLNLKKKARNKACVEGSICEAYVLQEISNFSAMYFEPSVQTKFNRVPRQDDGGYVDSNRQLSVFCHSGRAFGFHRNRSLNDNEFKAAKIYVLLNTIEIEPYCDWYGSDKGVKIDSLHGLVDIKYRSRLASNEPFILASQAHQVYYARYPHRTQNTWWAVCNMKARNNCNFRWHENPPDNVQEVDDDIFQEIELHVSTPVSVSADLDIPRVLLGDGPMEEVNLNDIIVPRFSDDNQLDDEEQAENDEWEDDDENDNVKLDVDNEEVGFEYESTARTGESSRVPSIDSRASRGSAHLELPPADLSDRQLIKAISDETIRTISTIIRAHMLGPYPTWSKFPEGARELCFRQFLAHYRFEIKKE